MKTRPATAEEIIEQFKRSIASGDRIQYRGFLRERAMRTARNGVRHIQYFRARIFVQDGEPCIHTSNGVEKLAATMVEIPSDAHAEIKAGIKEVLFDLRIKSEYLK